MAPSLNVGGGSGSKMEAHARYSHEPIKNEVLLPDRIQKYLKKHDVQDTVTKTLNKVLKETPDDPFGVLVREFSKLAVDSPLFTQIRAFADPPEPGDAPEDARLNLRVLVSIRGAPVCVHNFVIMADMLHKVESAATDAEGGGATAAPLDVARYLQELLTEVIAKQSLDEFGDLHERLEKALRKEPLACPDVAMATAVLLEELLAACANASDCSGPGFFIRTLDRLGYEPPLAKPELNQPSDLQRWRRGESGGSASRNRWSHWPFLTYGISAGGEGTPVLPAGLTLALALSPFCAEGREGARSPEALIVSEAPATVAQHQEEGEEQEQEQPKDPRARDCPPPNFAELLETIAKDVQEKIPEKLAEDLSSTTSKLKAQLEGMGVPLTRARDADEEDPSKPPAPTGSGDEGHQAQEEEEDAAGAAAVGAWTTEVPLAGCVLFVMADQVWDEERQVYELQPDTPLTPKDLVNFYEKLYRDSEGFLLALVQPFRQEDCDVCGKVLRERCPNLRLLLDYGTEEPTSSTPAKFPRKPTELWSYVAKSEGGSASSVFRQYTERAGLFPAGPAGIIQLDEVALSGWGTGVADLALALGGTEHLYFPRKVMQKAVDESGGGCCSADISARFYEHLFRALNPPEELNDD